MNTEVKDALAAHRKWVILEFAKGVGNNAKACREFGVPKSTFYEWKKAYAEGGKAGLLRKKPVAKKATVAARKTAAGKSTSKITAKRSTTAKPTAKKPAARKKKPVEKKKTPDTPLAKTARTPAPAAEPSKRKRKYTRRSKRPGLTTPVVTAKFQGKQVLPSALKAEKETPLVLDGKTKRYSQKDLDYFRDIILEKIRDANEELISIEERMTNSATGDYNDDDSTYSLHMADQGTDAMEREKAFLFASRERKFISHLTDALQRIKSGNYGICISCANLIEKGRLQAVPHARMCVACKNKTKSE